MRLLDRIKQLDERKESIAKVSGDLDATSEDLVEINAGGKVIALHRSTLTQIEGSRLSALFSGRYDKKLIRDTHGRIFLDVNLVCFQAIVHYLVDHKTASEDNPPTPASVDSEYQADLMHTLELFGINDTHADVAHALVESQIVTDANHVKHLCDWLIEDSSYGDFLLLYRSSRDGRNDQTFHSKCVTIIKTKDGHIIGGYSPCRWMSDNTYASSNKAFLFAISKTDKFSPSKIKLTGSQDYSIYKHPTFGSDLKVAGRYVSVNNRFPMPIFGRRFNIKEMEVFQIIPNSENQTSILVETVGRNPVTSKNVDTHKVVCFTPAVNSALNQKWKALNDLESELDILEASLEDEKKFIAFFSQGKDKDVVALK
jgi:hypothetical protein